MQFDTHHAACQTHPAIGAVKQNNFKFESWDDKIKTKCVLLKYYKNVLAELYS